MDYIRRKRILLEQYDYLIFPVICLSMFIILCITSIHGSSIGYYKTSTNQNSQDSSLLFGKTRSIRSDEWVVTTPFIYSQKTENYPVINKTIGNGQDMALVLDVPYKEWSTVFRPQNLLFFVAPFSVAFSFRWWLPLLILVISTYLLIREFIPKNSKNIISAVLAVSFSLSPFILWWYAAGTLLAIGYVFLIVYLAIKLLKSRELIKKAGLASLITYFGVCLAITMYIPFIIASCFAGFIIFVAFLLSQKNHKELLTKENIICLITVVVIAGLILSAFYFVHRDAIKLIQDTVYPGRRVSSGAKLSIDTVFNLFKQPFLQSNYFVAKYSINQSESSNFIYIFPYLVLPIIYQLYRSIKLHKLDKFLATIFAGLCIVLARMFIPGIEILFKPFLLDRVPNDRLLIALGMLNFMLIIAMIRNIKLNTEQLPKFIKIMSIITAAVILYLQYILFKSNFAAINRLGLIYIVILCISLMLMVFLFLDKKTILYAALIYLIVTLSMSFYINPIYRGVFFEKDQLINAIQEQDNIQDGTWIVVNNVPFEQYPQMAGERSLSGVMTYPQYELWKNFPNNPNYQDTINRYAHITFTINNETEEKIVLRQADNYIVNINPCNNFVQQSIQYIISFNKEVNSCLSLKKSVQYGTVTAYIYRVTNKPDSN